MSTEIRYWQPRVMRHSKKESVNEFAIHEVYFSDHDEVVTYTEDALSPRESSVEVLKQSLQMLLAQPGEIIICGDQHYAYTKEEIQNWLNQMDLPMIDYE